MKIELNLVKKVRQYNAENGLNKTLIWVTIKTLKNILVSFINLRKCYLLKKSLTGNLPCFKAKIDVTFKLADLKDLESFQGILKPWNLKFGLFDQRFQRGQTCIVCFHKMHAIGYIWFSSVPETDRKLGLTIQPQDDESYGFDLFVLPEYRKFLVGFELISRWLKYSQEAGKQKVIGLIINFNKPMLMMTKLAFGFKITKQFYSLEFFRWRGIIIANKEIG